MLHWLVLLTVTMAFVGFNDILARWLVACRLCGLSALDFYSIMENVGFEIDFFGSENNCGLDTVGLSLWALWALEILRSFCGALKLRSRDEPS